MAEPTKTTVTFKFERDRDYRVVACNNAWGGVSPRGELRIEFVLDSWPSPIETVHDVEADSTIGAEVQRNIEGGPGQISRTAMFGAVMTADIAEEIGKFLIKKAAEKRALDKQTQHASKDAAMKEPLQ